MRIRNYRTIGSEQTIEVDGGVTIVGPNNSGKTNLLRAVELLFTGYENVLGYRRSTDLTFSAGSRVKTSLLATFTGDPDDPLDAPIYRELDELHALLGTERTSASFSLSLQFTETNNALYQFFPNSRKPAEGALRTQYSRTERQLVRDLLGRFECHYVPSAKSVASLYEDLLMPFLRRLAARAVEPYVGKIHEALAAVANDLNGGLARVGLENLKISFSFPDGSEEHLFAGFDLKLADPHETAIDRKGQGIQSTALLASFLWIAREEARTGKSTIWLLEEPESYLHPELSHSCRQLLDELRQESLVVATTHSLAFVPIDPRRMCGTELVDRETAVQVFKTYSEATARIRSTLGVRFSDYYNLDAVNLLVEGPSDRELIGWALERLDTGVGKEWALVRAAAVLDFGGVRHLAGFLRTTYQFIRNERAAVALFDGDAAGTKERQDLQQYFGQIGVPFDANRDFLSVRDRFAIEGLFPDVWIIEMQAEHPGWFDSFSIDVSGSLEPFRLKTGTKGNAVNWLRLRANEAPVEEWAGRWIDLLDGAELALNWHVKRVEGLGVVLGSTADDTTEPSIEARSTTTGGVGT